MDEWADWGVSGRLRERERVCCEDGKSITSGKVIPRDGLSRSTGEV